MKKFWKFFIVMILFVVYIYVLDIESIPNNVVLFNGEKLNITTVLGLSLEDNNTKSIWTSSSLNNKINNKTDNINVNLFGKINIKTINVSVISNANVIPIGMAIGMKLYTKGVMVVGMSEIETDDNTKVKPFENSGIEEGDSIISINNNEVSNTSELVNQVNSSKGQPINIEYVQDNNVLTTSITPVKSNNKYKIGLWVRDAAAGVGTLTFYEPSTNNFMSLGHGIVDVDTGEIVDIANGDIVTANIISIIKGQKDSPGEIQGTIQSGKTIGSVYNNTNLGVYGTVTNKEYLNINDKNSISVATRNEIKQGEATILCQLDNDLPKEYKIEIEKIYYDNNDDNKSMLVKITDENLIEQTGGIIQGMSGAPIIQNGKFVGAITNVLVKDPTQGYAVFGDLLIKQIREVK